MKIAVFGTGIVGRTIGSKLTGLGHDAMMGSRTPDNAKAAEWVASAGEHASQGTFEDAARFGEIIFNCTAGTATLDALAQAGAGNLGEKIMIDISNPLDFSNGFPPSLSVCNTDSLAEQIQRAYPDLKVVKALNTMTCSVMVDPSLVPGDHNVFLSGNDADAKAQVSQHLSEWFGWKPGNILDLGDITSARGTEMLLPFWLRVFGTLQNPVLNFHIVQGPRPQPQS